MIIVIARKITFFFFHAAARAEEQQQQQDVRTLNDASVFFNPLRAFLTFYVYPSFLSRNPPV